MLLLDPVLGAAPVVEHHDGPCSGQREVRIIRRPRRGRRQHITTLGGLGGTYVEDVRPGRRSLCLVTPSPVDNRARFPGGHHGQLVAAPFRRTALVARGEPRTAARPGRPRDRAGDAAVRRRVDRRGGGDDRSRSTGTRTVDDRLAGAAGTASRHQGRGRHRRRPQASTAPRGLPAWERVDHPHGVGQVRHRQRAGVRATAGRRRTTYRGLRLGPRQWHRHRPLLLRAEPGTATRHHTRPARTATSASSSGINGSDDLVCQRVSAGPVRVGQPCRPAPATTRVVVNPRPSRTTSTPRTPPPATSSATVHRSCRST